MTISDYICEKAKKLDMQYQSMTTTWNIHAGIATGANSNFKKEATKLHKKGFGIVYGIPGARGRSQHSATELLIFTSDHQIDTIEIMSLSNGPCGWYAESI